VTLRAGSPAAILAMHLPVIISLMLIDPIGVTADAMCVRITPANSSTELRELKEN
jgi:hypothetical protein